MKVLLGMITEQSGETRNATGRSSDVHRDGIKATLRLDFRHCPEHPLGVAASAATTAFEADPFVSAHIVYLNPA
jgi:hypothetical protein